MYDLRGWCMIYVCCVDNCHIGAAEILLHRICVYFPQVAFFAQACRENASHAFF